MNSIIIPEYTQSTLSPLLCGRKITDLPILGVPIKEHIARALAKHGVDTSALRDGISNSEAFGNADGDGILAIEGNLLTLCDFTSVISEHRRKNSDITVVVNPPSDGTLCRAVSAGKDGMLSDICHCGNSFIPSAYELEGIAILSRQAAGFVSKSGIKPYLTDIIRLCMDNFRIFVYVSHSKSIAVSAINTYREAHRCILNGTLPMPSNAVEIKSGMWVEDDVDIESGVKIEPPVYISRRCGIERGAKIGAGTVLGEGCTIKSGAEISNSILEKSCSIRENALLCGCILASDVTVGVGASVQENAVVGHGCRIESDCLINSCVSIWPNKRILSGTRLSDNLVRGSVGTEHLFRNGKIRGEINVDITPEFMAKLGSALGTVYHNKKIGVSRDYSPVCAMLAQALLSGLLSTGARVYVFGEQTLPMTRLGISGYELATAIHISQNDAGGVFSPEIDFLEGDGSSFGSASEKELETAFFGNMFVRASSKNIREPFDISGYKFAYIHDILGSLKSGHYNRNVEIRTRSETISEMLELLLEEIEQKTDVSAAKEFSAEIGSNGQEISLYKADGEKLGNSQKMSLAFSVLINHSDCKKIALPVSAPLRLERELADSGAEIIKCGASNSEFIRTMLKNKLYDQFRMFFDGIFCTLMTLDYLNFRGIGFDELLSSLPSSAFRETEVECPGSRKQEIIRLLCTKYRDERTDLTDGLKIYQRDGWVLIIPEKYRHYIRIITEAADMETAGEISMNFTNQIKRLAKPQ